MVPSTSACLLGAGAQPACQEAPAGPATLLLGAQTASCLRAHRVSKTSPAHAQGLFSFKPHPPSMMTPTPSPPFSGIRKSTSPQRLLLQCSPDPHGPAAGPWDFLGIGGEHLFPLPEPAGPRGPGHLMLVGLNFPKPSSGHSGGESLLPLTCGQAEGRLRKPGPFPGCTPGGAVGLRPGGCWCGTAELPSSPVWADTRDGAALPHGGTCTCRGSGRRSASAVDAAFSLFSQSAARSGSWGLCPGHSWCGSGGLGWLSGPVPGHGTDFKDFEGHRREFEPDPFCSALCSFLDANSPSLGGQWCRLQSQTAWAQMLALSLARCVTVDKSFNFSVP